MALQSAPNMECAESGSRPPFRYCRRFLTENFLCVIAPPSRYSIGSAFRINAIYYQNKIKFIQLFHLLTWQPKDINFQWTSDICKTLEVNFFSCRIAPSLRYFMRSALLPTSNDSWNRQNLHGFGIADRITGRLQVTVEPENQNF